MKRKFELGRQPSMTKLGERRVHQVRCHGGFIKFRALKVDHGNFAWPGEAVTRKCRIITVSYNATNPEYVRTNTITKGCIVQIDATPFKNWYQKHYGVTVGKAIPFKKSKRAPKKSRAHRPVKPEKVRKEKKVDENALEKKGAKKVTGKKGEKKGDAKAEGKKATAEKKGEKGKAGDKKGSEKKAVKVAEKKTGEKKAGEKAEKKGEKKTAVVAKVTKTQEKKVEKAKPKEEKKVEKVVVAVKKDVPKEGAKPVKKEKKSKEVVVKKVNGAFGKVVKKEKKASQLKYRPSRKHGSKHRPSAAMVKKWRLRNATRVLEAAVQDQLERGRIYARVSTSPGQCGSADGYVLEGDELAFYEKKIQIKKKK